MKDLLDNYHKLSDEKKSLLKILLKEKGIDINKKLILPQKREGNIFPLSFSQQRLWFLEQLEPNSSLYIIPSAVKISGPVKIDFLLKGLDIIVRRHEILRTRFIEKEGEGYQEILDEIKISPIEYDLSEEKIDAESKAADIIKNEFSKPFRLSECPLFRVVIIKITEDVNYLLLPMHHIISDNWSTGILIKELLECYKSQLIGKEPNLAAVSYTHLTLPTTPYV
jgi:NRPS condensation-like uncharacterized protein